MDCRITSIRARRTGRRAFTLSETLIAMGIGGIVLTAVAALSLYSGRSLAAMANYSELDNASRYALDILSRDVRQANSLTSYNTNQHELVFADFDGAPLTFIYAPPTRTLKRIKGGSTTTLLTECDTLAFEIFQRNPIGGTYDQYQAATAATAKLISVSWRCSRTIFQQKVNTESVQTAKIVIRKQ